jgi:hypothetical protein
MDGVIVLLIPGPVLPTAKILMTAQIEQAAPWPR